MRNYSIIRNSDLLKQIQLRHKGSKISASLPNLRSSKYVLSLITYKGVKNKAEYHNFEDDIYVVLSGKAVVTLGGKLVNPRELNDNDILAEDITEGESEIIEKNDIIIIPRQTPHMLDVRNSEISYLVIKVR